MQPLYFKRFEMDFSITGYCLISEKKVIVNDQLRFYQENFLNFANFIKSLYKLEEINYPKFYKMDSLSKLGFLASELVLKVSSIKKYREDELGVVLSNSSSSLDTDIVYQNTINDRFNYFPSPSVFVYTLPNIVIGEICIKFNIKGENAFLISETFNGRLICNYVNEMMEKNRVQACLCGWVEYLGDKFETLVMLVEKSGFIDKQSNLGYCPTPFTEQHLNQLLHRN